ncbi:MAG: nitroreductase/quinone reductase family protein [Pseudomonadales bacterium]|nr:nitroreductase/quinone reductase family protein [Pseudomonadales bacterium]MDP6315170.1 nitroreductase/quinone reductase family protein [Pseudomonadales bacterium]MDP7314411.1 nitroreductase/quinone reductase family protein [Pseudomonadales bacterium]MDP7575611.1 nitroreductase/quinone reductase family protein [Pseudomonadales bacterium]HJP51481.1 nitroreductase/quinone reductase family protein [Pseudomonadales bacterium]
MKLPEPLFVIVNPIVTLLLRSPLHSLMSGSLMLITFTGRRSKRKITTPLRYVVVGEVIRCYTSSETMWWRNLKGGAEVELHVAGKSAAYRAEAIYNDPRRIRSALEHYLDLHPQDAAYQEIRLNKDKNLNQDDLEKASHVAVVVEARAL